jgi:hypothetical protein
MISAAETRIASAAKFKGKRGEGETLSLCIAGFF